MFLFSLIGASSTPRELELDSDSKEEEEQRAASPREAMQK